MAVDIAQSVWCMGMAWVCNPASDRHAACQRAFPASGTVQQSNHSKSKRLWGMLMQYAIDLGWRDTDHTVGVRRVKVRSVGIHSWTDAEIAQYEAHWPPGSKPRLALAILLYTGQRRSDAVRMGPADTIEGTIRVRQVKTGAGLLIPVHPALEIELSAWTDCGAGTLSGNRARASIFGQWVL